MLVRIGGPSRLEEERIALGQGLALLDLERERQGMEPGDGVESGLGLLEGESARELGALEAPGPEVLEDEEGLGRLGAVLGAAGRAVVRVDAARYRQLDHRLRVQPVLLLEHLEIRHDLWGWVEALIGY